MAEIDVPLISLAGWFSDDADAKAAVVAAVKHACERAGFFMIKDHGVNTAVIDAVWKVRRRAGGGARGRPPQSARPATRGVASPEGSSAAALAAAARVTPATAAPGVR